MPATSAETRRPPVWLVGTDTPDTARDYLKETFEDENEGWTLKIEEKTWATPPTSTPRRSRSEDRPDVVEIGNTQALGFADAGLFLDISDIQEDARRRRPAPRSRRGRHRTTARSTRLRTTPVAASSSTRPQITGDAVPATLDEYVAKGKELKTDTVSGIYFAGKDWYNALPFIWAHGGEIAVQDGDEWDAQFSSDESVKGLEQLQDVYLTPRSRRSTATSASATSRSATARSAILSSPAWAAGNITGAWPWGDEAAGEEVSEGCPDTYGSDLAAFALPGLKAGETAPIFAGGSNIAVATKSDSQDKAKEALKIMLSEGYQKLLAEQGLTPGYTPAAESLPDTAIAKAQAEALANSKFTPTSPNWAEVESAQIIPDALVKIAQGGDVKAIAEELDASDRSDPQQVDDPHEQARGSRPIRDPLAPLRSLGQAQGRALHLSRRPECPAMRAPADPPPHSPDCRMRATSSHDSPRTTPIFPQRFHRREEATHEQHRHAGP